MVSVAEALGLGRSLLIYYGRPWRNFRIGKFYAGFVGSGDLVFDIGAHVGNRTRILHRIGAQVIAVEPQPLFHRFLAITLPGDGVILRREAVGAEPGYSRLHISSRYPTVSTLSHEWIGRVQSASGFEMVAWDRDEMVPVTTLDQLIRDHGMPRFCKIDVEGMEFDILRGLSHAIPWISFEYLPAAADLAERCVDLLAALGRYRFNRVEGEDHEFRHQHWLTPNRMREDVRHAAVGNRSGDIYAMLD